MKSVLFYVAAIGMFIGLIVFSVWMDFVVHAWKNRLFESWGW